MKIKRILVSLLFCLVCLVIPTSLLAQEKTEKKVIKPILVDKTVISGVGLRPVKNKDQPERKLFQRRLFWGKDLGVFIVSSETATANHKSYGIEEFLYNANGRARVKPNSGKEQIFSAGDFFVVPKGFNGEWETQGGTLYHYELSVITTKRSPKGSFGKSLLPYSIDKAKLSGIGLTKVKSANGKEFYRDELFKGIELSIHLEAEEGQTRKVDPTKGDQLVYVIAGTVKISGESLATQTFYTGDFFILPRGFTGNWVTKGHHLFRTLRVTKSS